MVVGISRRRWANVIMSSLTHPLRFGFSLPGIAQTLNEGSRQLRAARVSEERRTAGLLLCHALGIDRAHPLTTVSPKKKSAKRNTGPFSR